MKMASEINVRIFIATMEHFWVMVIWLQNVLLRLDAVINEMNIIWYFTKTRPKMFVR